MTSSTNLVTKHSVAHPKAAMLPQRPCVRLSNPSPRPRATPHAFVACLHAGGEQRAAARADAVHARRRAAAHAGPQVSAAPPHMRHPAGAGRPAMHASELHMEPWPPRPDPACMHAQVERTCTGLGVWIAAHAPSLNQGAAAHWTACAAALNTCTHACCCMPCGTGCWTSTRSRRCARTTVRRCWGACPSSCAPRSCATSTCPPSRCVRGGRAPPQQAHPRGGPRAG